MCTSNTKLTRYIKLIKLHLIRLYNISTVTHFRYGEYCDSKINNGIFYRIEDIHYIV